MLLVMRTYRVALRIISKGVYRFLYRPQASTKRFGKQASEKVDKRLKRIVTNYKSLLYGVVAVIVWIDFSDLLFSIGSVNFRDVIKTLAVFIPHFGLLMIIYMPAIMILTGVLLIVELKKYQFDTKGIRVFSLEQYFHGILSIILAVSLLFLAYVAYPISLEALIPVCMKTYFVVSGNDPFYSYSESTLFTLFPITDAAIRYMLLHLSPYLLLSYALIFVGRAVPYLYFRGWKYSLILLGTLGLSSLLGSLLSSLITKVTAYSNPFLVSICVATTFFSLFLFITLLQNILIKEEE